MRRIILALVMFFTALWSASACEMAFKLVDGTGSSRKILPGSTIALDAGKSYTIKVEFTEDHRNCLLEPEDTLFLLDGAKWRVNKEDQGLVLTKAVTWFESGKSLNLTDLVFKAATPGKYGLTILRECAKGGYDEVINFVVK